MIGATLIFFSVLTIGLGAELLSFPARFKFGAATAAYQVEGGWNASDKSPSVWDMYTHKDTNRILDHSNGDVACDSYHLWERDIEMAVELGLNFYRFSISWPRVCPNGLCNKVSKDGTAYYNQLINGLLAQGNEPVITMYHWDLPQRLQDLGGWANPLVVDWFVEYARILLSLYADRVKTWITFNEPLTMCDGGYGTFAAPFLDDSLFGAYLCNRHILLAHAKVWRIYDEEFKHKYPGQMSIANHLVWFESERSEETELAELALQNCAGRYSHAIYSKEGGWPPTIEKLIAEASKTQGYSQSRLPPFTTEEIDLIKDTYDFYAVNFYTSKLVKKAKPGDKFGIWPVFGSEELGIILGNRPEWKDTTAWWFKENAKGFRDLMNWLKQQYGPLKFLITENGVPNLGSNLNDTGRVEFFESYLSQLLLAIEEDGVDVTGYTLWSLMDNFEWWDGYTNKFGIYEVNFTDPMRTRTPRSSAHYYASIIANRAPPTAEVFAAEENPRSNLYILWIVIGIAIVLTAIVLFVFYKIKARKKEDTKYASVAVIEDATKTAITN